MSLHEAIKQIAEAEGADFFGIADLDLAKEEVARQGGEEVAAYPRAVSVGIRLIDSVVDQLVRRELRTVAAGYRHHCYDVINDRLDRMVSLIASHLQRDGYRTYPIPSSLRVDDEHICAQFSHKLAAHLAGLGWIGKSCLLVTPEAGPRVRFATVLTDAPLVAGTPMGEACGDCTKCTDICPAAAFTGRNFSEDEPREARYDARKCQGHLYSTEKPGHPAVCGMCLYICPHGKKEPSFRSQTREHVNPTD